MHKIKYYLSLLFILLTISHVVIASESQETPPPATIVTVKPTLAEFVITLKANPTTGYSWFLRQYDNNLVSLVSHHYQASTTRLVGAGCLEEWHFKLQPQARLAPIITTISFVYARPWEILPSSVTTITVVVQ